jgi:hypothetical protein
MLFLCVIFLFVLLCNYRRFHGKRVVQSKVVAELRGFLSTSKVVAEFRVFFLPTRNIALLVSF